MSTVHGVHVGNSSEGKDLFCLILPKRVTAYRLRERENYMTPGCNVPRICDSTMLESHQPRIRVNSPRLDTGVVLTSFKTVYECAC